MLSGTPHYIVVYRGTETGTIEMTSFKSPVLTWCQKCVHS